MYTLQFYWAREVLAVGIRAYLPLTSPNCVLSGHYICYNVFSQSVGEYPPMNVLTVEGDTAGPRIYSVTTTAKLPNNHGEAVCIGLHLENPSGSPTLQRL